MPEKKKIKNRLVSNHITIGDIDINILKEDDIATQYLNLLSENNLISMINKPIRGRSCLDHIFLKTVLIDAED